MSELFTCWWVILLCEEKCGLYPQFLAIDFIQGWCVCDSSNFSSPWVALICCQLVHHRCKRLSLHCPFYMDESTVLSIKNRVTCTFTFFSFLLFYLLSPHFTDDFAVAYYTTKTQNFLLVFFVSIFSFPTGFGKLGRFTHFISSTFTIRKL